MPTSERFSNHPSTDLLEFSKAERVKLTLLGYKTTGRGAKAKKSLTKDTAIQSEAAKWAPLVKDGWYVGIDTALAAQVPSGVFDERTLRRLEGTHSMYIDAVAGTAGPSSYCDPSAMIPVEGINKTFREIQRTVPA